MGKCYCELGRSVLGWESVVFVTVNWAGQCWGWKSVVFVTVNWAGQCWGGKVLCLLL